MSSTPIHLGAIALYAVAGLYAVGAIVTARALWSDPDRDHGLTANAHRAALTIVWPLPWLVFGVVWVLSGRGCDAR